jgi:dephospho-CoA kinase
MKRIGLTGGIGSGKSTVSGIFRVLGIPCYSADDQAKLLLNTSSELKEKLSEQFQGIYKDGRLDKAAFAEIIFNDESKRKLANEIIHPFVRRDFESWSTNQNAPYVIQEAAILFETGAFKFFDMNILVCAPQKLRISRIQHRDNSSIEDIKGRMNSQWDDDKKRELADYCIENDEKHSLINQVLDIHREIILLSE